MDMINNTNQDEMLVKAFFDEHTQEIADHGFTKRVMRHLPDRSRRLNRIWTVICTVLGIVFFIAVRGWAVIADALSVCFRTIAAQEVFHLSPLTIALSVLLLTMVAAYQLVSRELNYN